MVIWPNSSIHGLEVIVVVLLVTKMVEWVSNEEEEKTIMQSSHVGWITL